MSNLDLVSVGAVVAALVLYAITIVAFAAEWSFSAGIVVPARVGAGTDLEAADDRAADVAARMAVPVAAAPAGAAGTVGASGTTGVTGATVVLDRPGPGGPGGPGAPSRSGGAGGPTAPARPGGRPPRVDHGPARARKAGAVGMNLTTLATVVLGVGVLTRGIAAHRVPWGNLYEFAITGTFVVLTVWLFANRRYPLRFLAIWLVGFATTCLGLARLFFYEDVGPLRPQLNSAWLVIHVSCAIVATGAFTVAAVTTILYLLKSRAEAKGMRTGYLARLPPSATLDRMAYRLTAFAFPIWTAAVIFGAIWAQYAYGQFWEWDPKETWSLITWVCYAAYLHARATAGWRGRLAATIAVVAFATVLFNLLAVNFLLAGKHSYAS